MLSANAPSHSRLLHGLPYPRSAPLMFFLASLRKPFEYSSSNRLRSYNNHIYEPCGTARIRPAIVLTCNQSAISVFSLPTCLTRSFRAPTA